MLIYWEVPVEVPVDQLGRFAGLCAYRIENGAVTPIAQRWWKTGPCQKLAALSATLQAEESANETETEDEYKLRHARELAKWRDKSPGLLPAGAFVFKEEFQLIYSNEFEYGRYHFMGDDRQPLSASKHSERMALDYSPFVDSQTATLIMDGFERYALTVGAAAEELPLAKKRENATPAPVVAASDAPAIPKNQRPDLLAPLIEKAQRGESDPFNAAVIWPKLCDMAEQKLKPFIGKTGDGLQWIDAFDDPQFMSKNALSDRLRRAKKAAIELAKPR